MDYEKEAAKVLDSRGCKPSRPQVLSLMGKIVNDLYDEIYNDITKDNDAKDGHTSIEIQREALDFTFKKLSIIKMDEGRKSFEENGYIKIYSPILEENVYLCQDHMFDSIKDRFSDVIYKASELSALKGLTTEDIKCLHMGKKVMRGSILI